MSGLHFSPANPGSRLALGPEGLDLEVDILPGAPLPPSNNRQQDRKNQRLKQKLEEKILAACRSNPLTQSAYDMGYNQGLQRGCEFSLKDAYAASLLAANEVYRFGKKRNRRLLKAIDRIVINRMTTEDLIDEVFQRFGIRIDFSEPFERVVDVDG